MCSAQVRQFIPTWEMMVFGSEERASVRTRWSGLASHIWVQMWWRVWVIDGLVRRVVLAHTECP